MSAPRGVVAAALLAAALPGPGQAQERRDALPRPSAEAEAAFLSFRHAGLVDTVLTAVYDRDSLYVPLGEAFRTLGVPVVLDLDRGRATGFFLHPRARYEIDLAAGIARVSGEEIALGPADGLLGDLDLFVLPSALERVFGVRVLVDLGELALRIDPGDRVFPIVAAERRRRLRATTAGADRLAPHAPLRAERLRRRLYGGVLDYSLDASTGAGANFTSFGLATGFEAFGGDLEAGVRGVGSGEGLRASDVRGSWRYVFSDEERRLSQLRVGSLTAAGVGTFDLHGIRVTNEPVQHRRLFSIHLIRGQTEPDAEVELYVNGQLQDFAMADGLGAYEFRLPLFYGRSVVSLRFYGPSGEFLREERGVPVPFGLVPAGEVDYSVAGGVRARDAGTAILTRVAWGVTDRITNAAGIEYIGDAAAGSEIVFFESLAARLTEGLHASLELAPGAFARAAVEGFSSSLASGELEVARFSDSPGYNPRGDDWRFRLRGFSPFRVGRVGMTGRLVADWTRSKAGDADASLELEAVASVGRLRQSVGLRGRSTGDFFGPAESRELLLGTLYNVSGHAGALAPLNGTLLRALYTRGLHEASADRVELALSRPLTRATRISVSAERNFALDAGRFEVRVTYDGDPLLATLGVQRDAGGTRLRQTLRGALAVDPANRRIVPTKQPWIGRSGAAFRFFIDRDGDRAYSPGEELVDGGAVRFRESVAVRRGADSVLRAVDLLAYYQYSVRIDDSSVSNPALVPAVREFSFVTDPSSYKPIDVPFYVGGEVDGVVTMADGSGTRPLAGARLNVRCVEGCEYRGSTSTFADGSFYLPALPPGRYEVSLDAEQLQAIGADAVPARHAFRLEFDPVGDYVTGLDFVVTR
ncbi:MAG TPA: carboxypeptidase-like regulatory domain-containing protein [Longimicrobiales bacterium]|nr:carboxypeptidase-like regulatory domain-containing protein [Longimicrobiales bacterium]